MVFGLLKRKKKKTTRRKTSRRKTTRTKAKRRTVRRKTSRRKSRSSRRRTKRRGKPFGGYEIVPDEHLARIVGKKPVSPSQMTKNVWSYVKRKRLARK